MGFGTFVVNFDQNRAKSTIHFTKMLVNGDTHLECKLQNNEKDSEYTFHDTNLHVLFYLQHI